MALSAQKRAMAGSEGRGEHGAFVPAPSRGRRASLPPASSGVPAPGPRSARPPPVFITQLFSHCGQFITRGGAWKSLRAFIRLCADRAEGHFLGQRGEG